jgi:hypothetical protein
MISEPIMMGRFPSQSICSSKESDGCSPTAIPIRGEQPLTTPQDNSPVDRRASNRYRTVCLVVRVRRTDDTGLWRVRNISDDGLMLAAAVLMEVGERLEIILSETVTLVGEIVWTEGGCCGVAFLKPIDAAATLRALAAEQRNDNYRVPQLPIWVQAIVTLRDNARAIDLIDISRNGAGFQYEAPLVPGTEIELLLPGIKPGRKALVRWSRGKRGGLSFTEPLDPTDLEKIARFQRPYRAVRSNSGQGGE